MFYSSRVQVLHPLCVHSAFSVFRCPCPNYPVLQVFSASQYRYLKRPFAPVVPAFVNEAPSVVVPSMVPYRLYLEVVLPALGMHRMTTATPVIQVFQARAPLVPTSGASPVSDAFCT